MEQHRKSVQCANTGVTIKEVAVAVCSYLGVEEKMIHRRTRGGSPSKARRIIAYICNRRHGIPTGAIALYFKVSSPAISGMIRDGETFAREIGEVALGY